MNEPSPDSTVQNIHFFLVLENVRVIACAVIGQFEFIIKEIKNAPECIVELYKHAGIFKNTREVHREARGVAECFSHFYIHTYIHTYITFC